MKVEGLIHIFYIASPVYPHQLRFFIWPAKEILRHNPSMLYLSRCIILIIYLQFIYSANENLYTLLGVSKSASQQDIRKAYRNKARETHPDKHTTTEDKEKATIQFRKIVDAYEILSDENSRREYDRTGQSQSNSQRDRNQQGNQGFGSSGFNFHDWFFNNNRNQQYSQQQQRRRHRYIFDPYIRPQVRLFPR